MEGPPSAAESRFDLAPKAWIQRPAVPRRPVGITGQVLPNTKAITGKLPGCGQSDFAAHRKPDASQQAAAIRPMMPPSAGGPFEGAWRGAVTCPRGAQTDTFPLSLIISQQGTAEAATLTESLPDRRSGLTMDKVGVFLSGVVGGGGTLNGATLDNRSIPIFPHSLVLDPASGVVRLDLYASRCVASVTRTGAFPRNVAGMPSGLPGTWTLASSAYRDTHSRPGSSVLRDETAVLDFERRGDLVFGRLQAFTPADRPVTEQDRLVVNLRPLITLPDGRIGFVSTDQDRAEGAFKRGARGEVAWLSRGFLLVVRPPTPQENELEVALATDRGLFLQPTEVFIRRGAGESVIVAEGGVPLELPFGLGGRLAAARSLRQQCDVLANWAKPLTGRPDARTAPVDRLQRETLPLFEDDVFVPVFGLSYAMTTPAHRRPIFSLIDQRCSQQFGMHDLNHYDLYAPFESQNEGSFAYSAVTAGLLEQREAGATAAAARGRLPLIPATDAGLAELATFERTLPEPLDLLTDAERQATAALLADTRQRIANAMLQTRVDAVGDWPASEDGLHRLEVLRADVDASSLAADQKHGDLAKLADRKRAIITAMVEEAGQQIAKAPLSLPGLKEATVALRRIGELRQRVGKPGPTVRGADPATERRAAILADAAVQQAFGEAMTQVAHATASPAAVLSVAAAYLQPDEVDVPPGTSPFRVSLDAALQQAEDDHRTRVLQAGAANAPASAETARQPAEPAMSLSGEPAPEDMEGAVENIASDADSEQDDIAGRCARREFHDDPGLALICLGQIGAGGPMHIHVASFRKIGCAKAVEKPGYICDYAFTLDVAAGRQMGILGDMMAAGGNCTGRFVLAGGRWLLRERECG